MCFHHHHRQHNKWIGRLGLLSKLTNNATDSIVMLFSFPLLLLSFFSCFVGGGGSRSGGDDDSYIIAKLEIEKHRKEANYIKVSSSARQEEEKNWSEVE